jgi:hypothetical protein
MRDLELGGRAINVPLVGRRQRACRTVVVLVLAVVGWFGGAYEEDRLDWA